MGYDWTMVRFGPFEVDFTTSEMRKSGTRVRIQEQPLRILHALVGRPGEIVTREELRERQHENDFSLDWANRSPCLSAVLHGKSSFSLERVAREEAREEG